MVELKSRIQTRDRSFVNDGNVEVVDGFVCPTDPALANLCEGCE